jgi:hypothetical protein
VIDDAWEIEPGLGVGPARFGMTRSSLRERLGSFRAFRRGSTPDLTDQYDAGLLMLTCSDDEGLYLIEVADPWTVTFRGVRLGGAAAEVVAALRDAGAEPVEDHEGGWELAGGAVHLAVEPDEPDAEVEGVTVAAPSHVGGDIIRVDGGATGEPVLSHTVEPGRGLGVVTLGEPRAAVRRRLHEAMTSTTGPGTAEDHFWADGLVVRYSADDRVERISVHKADRVDYAGVTVLPGMFDEVRQTLLDAGHAIEDRELAVEIRGTGIQLWLANTQTTHRLPVSAVVLSSAGW